MALTLNSAPQTLVEPVTEILHGVAIADPYRWLEDQDSPRTRTWLETQTTYARSYLDAIPGRERIRKRTEELLTVEVISEPWKVGSKYFFLRRKRYQEQPVIVMRKGELGEEIVLVDPLEGDEGNTTAVSIIDISQNGELLAYGVRHGGEYCQAVQFINVCERRLLPDRLPHGFGPWLTLSPDASGFYYSHELIDCPRPYYRAVYWHQFGADIHEDVEIFFGGEDPKLHLGLFPSPDCRRFGYLVTDCRKSVTIDFYLQDLLHGTPARRIIEHLKAVFEPWVTADSVYALTDLDAPNLRIVAINPDNPEVEHWYDVVPESEHRIKHCAIVGNSIWVVRVENLADRIEVFDRSGGRYQKLPVPERGTARLLRHATDAYTLFYEFSSFEQPPTIFSYHRANGEQKVWAKTQVKVAASAIEVEEVHYRSKDETDLPMLLVRRKGHPSAGPMPTFLTAYGGFGACRSPQFNYYSSFLLEHGFLFALATVRGGGEFGEAWHRAGMRHNRQNTIDDFLAATEWLVSSGHTIPQKVAIGGGSNAGLLMGAALTQRPDLFGAVVCVGPLMDMLRYHMHRSSDYWIDEYGSSEDPEDFLHLLAYSPYHCVRDGVPYPSVLLVSGDADTCCNPLHARKMAARLQAANSSEHPIILDYKPTWGHAPAQPLSKRIEALSDRLAFICQEVGVEV